MDGCGKTRYRGEDLDDQNIILLLENEFRVRIVRSTNSADSLISHQQFRVEQCGILIR
jgi:hypothetical protein